MIKRIPFNLKLTISEYRALILKKPWKGKQWKDNDISGIKNKIKTQLIQNQNCCAYCGLPFKGEKDMQIEHIAPKANYRQPQFTFTLSNLVLSCTYCNTLVVKGTKETISPPINKLYKKCTFFIVHPYFDDPEEHFDWENTETSILIRSKNNSHKAINSIKMFELNSEYMSELRAANYLLTQRKINNPITSEDELLIRDAMNYLIV